MSRRPTGELESAVMDVLWDSAEWRTPGDVHARLAANGELAYTTVLTVLIRLWKKGRLERRREGKAHAYRPAVTREQFTAARIGELLAGVDRSAALAQFVTGLSAADRARLRRALETGERSRR